MRRKIFSLREVLGCRVRLITVGQNGNPGWKVPSELPDGFLEVHSITVDANGNLYAGDNQYGRMQKLVPKRGADPALLVGKPWTAR